MIRPVLFYGSVTCVLTKREEDQLLVFDRKPSDEVKSDSLALGVRDWTLKIGRHGEIFFNRP
jgi:hypothetical protein